jgi:hypothetical protein
MVKTKKKDSDQYNENLSINGRFEDALKAFESTIKCTLCGFRVKYDPPAREKNKKLYVTYICENGHMMIEELPTK